MSIGLRLAPGGEIISEPGGAIKQRGGFVGIGSQASAAHDRVKSLPTISEMRIRGQHSRF